jgi:predicted N-acetyltransferase YhbS
MVVDPPSRRKGVGSALLRALEERLVVRGLSEVTVMDCPQNYFMPGVDFRHTEAYCFLLKHGYQRMHENHNLLCDISADMWPEVPGQISALAAEGIEIRRARRGDEAPIHEFIGNHWPGWHDEVDGAYLNAPVSLHIALAEGRTVGFAGYQGNNRSLNWFGPMGTEPQLRGKGIGGILLRLCLLDLARQGWRTAIIPWVGPTRFYARYCGAKLDRCFWAYKKEL